MIEGAHCPCSHHGTEFVRNYLQESFIFNRLSVTLTKIRHNCFQGRGLHPLLAELPPTQFDEPSDNPFPFKIKKIDFIRTVFVVTKDTTEKSDTCVFRRLYPRAMHLKRKNNLTTNND